MLCAVNDMVFKFIFGDESRKELLRELINLVLERVGLPLASTLTINNPFDIRRFAMDKEPVLDIKATDDSGMIFDVEIQVREEGNYAERAIYYWSRVYGSQLPKGFGYEDLHPVIGIHLLDFSMHEDYPRFIRVFRFVDVHDQSMVTPYVLTEKATLITVELPQADRSVGCGRLENLLYLLESEGGDQAMTDSLVEQEEFLAKVDEAYRMFNANPELMDIYEGRHKARVTQTLAMNAARRKGRDEGKVEGKIETARIMKGQGLAPELIATCTGLSLDEISKA
jgi:predicted transposase/invertase (TIGR01784 family)